ncbi:GGDEF domain-containing protein [Actinomycetospora lemnae]|uniref:GGDEF domain-containing protein n=1 Tax=Actinomycetospora lemnae TaxID=3019891 RepID=A0ABT5SSA4_9PSEU|nr:GGDEF domain-containing protein [Actinomycetospora sp. DW7H6]MDD7965722.1 GGDEF domain-containing protein [Actinomycetospora sp. DW7H6]
MVWVRLAGLLGGRGNGAVTTAEPVRDGDVAAPEAPVVTPEAVVTCGFPTSPIVGLETVPADDLSPDGRADQARAHEAAAEVLADRGDWRRAYQHMKAAVSLVRDERTLPAGVPDQLRVEVDRLRRERAEAREQSRRDSLTATWNRRYLDERLSTLRHDSSNGGAVCVALADVDHFKHVNDTHGHALGDEVLRRLVDLMSEELPPDGFCARYGGEEFALVLPGLEPAEAVRVCEEARARVDAHPWHEIADDLRVTVSVGVACLDAADSGRPGSPGLDAADALLYVAKRAGRNAVAHRDGDGTVRLAGAAAARRGIAAAARRAFPTG